MPEVLQHAAEKSSVMDGFGDFAGQGFGDGRARSGEMKIEFGFKVRRARRYSRRTRLEMVDFEWVHFQLFKFLV